MRLNKQTREGVPAPRENAPIHFTVEGNNHFHRGWLACFLGFPRDCVSEDDFEDIYAQGAFLDGWDTCNETRSDGIPNRLHAFEGMRKNKQAKIQMHKP